MGQLKWLNVLLAMAAVGALGVLASRTEHSPGITIAAGDLSSIGARLHVEVTGAVLQPGPIEASPGDLVSDAIARAGGATADADLAAINTSRRVVDGDRIAVPRRDERPALLDLNQAARAQIEALPGIGAAYADAIVRARESGPFATTDQLVERDIIPSSTYELIRDLVAAH